MTAADDLEQDRRRLGEIQEELTEATPAAFGYGMAYLERRERLEREAAEIRARLGWQDDRTALPAKSSWWGWALLVLCGFAVVAFLAISAGV